MEGRRREFVSVPSRHMTAALVLVLTSYRLRFSPLTMEASLVTSITAP